MRRPTTRWEAADHVATLREGAAPAAWAGDARAEVFDLRFGDDARGALICGLEHQVACPRAAESPAIQRAVMAWLIARGQRKIHLRCGEETLARGPIAPRDLDTVEKTSATNSLISLAPSNAEVLDALGVFDRVIATENSSDHPPEVASLPKLGPDLAPDLDQVATMTPGLVLSSLSVPGMERNVAGLDARQIPQLVLAPRSIDEVMADLRRVGEAVGATAQAREAISRMEEERHVLRSRRRGSPTRVYLEWWPRPMFTPGADCYSNELIALAGGVNVFADRPGSSLEISAAELLAAAPEVCFVSWCGVPAAKLAPARLRTREGLEGLEAATAGRIYALDERFSGRPGPRMLEAARRMEAAIVRARVEG